VMAESVIQKVRNEFERWVDEAEVTGLLAYKSSSKSEGILVLEFADNVVTITVPDDYPRGEFFVDCPNHSKLSDKVNDFVMGKTLSAAQVFQKLADIIVDLDLLGMNESDDDNIRVVGDVPEDDTDPFEKPEKKESHWDEFDEKYRKMTFVHESSSQATQRLISDVKALLRSNTTKNGFSAHPKVVNGSENLYEWEVRLFDFEGDLGKDMKVYEKNTKKNYVEISIQFSKDYPFKPPFVRVIEPRFKFRTGNVTLGGAICMEMLTMSGWRAVNSVESVIMTVRAQIGSFDAGGRIEFTTGGSGYTEREAWEAFYRAANTHGWKTQGLGPDMFPKF